MESVLFIFLDGVGIGRNDPEINPFVKKKFKIFNQYFHSTPTLDNLLIKNEEAIVFPVDATLGVPGLPQSGTGQAAIFTGVNAPKLAGKHFGPFPHSATKQAIANNNIFKDLISKGKKVAFANAYPKLFFDYLKSGRNRLNVTSQCALKSGMNLRNSTDLRRGKAISGEITNYRWVNGLNYKLPIISPSLAARRILRMAGKNSFTLFDYFLTDHIGHWRLKEYFDDILEILDEFLFTLLTELPKDITLIITSDHGNLENISIKTHTTNPALTIVKSSRNNYFYENIKDLTQFKKAVLNILN